MNVERREGSWGERSRLSREIDMGGRGREETGGKEVKGGESASR